jgi:hypothetical protein
MKGDFTRNTFDPEKHYRDVLLQQGRVQVDADWNEQAELTARRDETTAADIIGDCGGPADGAAFGIVNHITIPLAANPSEQEPIETARAAQPPGGTIILPTRSANFFLSAGRYYVDGIQCENEEELLYTRQPDRFDVPELLGHRSYLVYLDVWQRHITVLEDGLIREPALGGPDHSTRVKTIWQVRALELKHGVDTNNPCGSGADQFDQLFDPGTAQLTAGTAAQQAPKDPCLIPASAGYTGLENQLYRVEIHDPGTALDAASNVTGFGDVTLPSGNTLKNQITVTGGPWAAGDIVEIYPSRTGSPKMQGQLARVIAVDSAHPPSLTLNIPVAGVVAADLPQLRKIVGATWKWSRENGSVVTRVERINGNEITVSSLGSDKNLGFTKDAWVEILDDALELESKPGQLAQIDDADEATRIITLKSAASSLVPAGFSTSTYPNGIVPGRNPKVRRWEGVGAVKYVGDPATNWLPLESGVQVKFAPNGDYRTGQYWQIPARTATAQSPAGDIEWQMDATGHRAALPAFGIKHHLCRLGIVTPLFDGSVEATDCRCLWPALTNVPRLFYVSGDGQEVMPTTSGDPLGFNSSNFFKLPQPLIVGLGNGQCAPPGTKVRFSVIAPPSTGRVAVVGTTTPTGQIVDVPIGANGMAGCDFHLDGTHYSQQVRAELLDAAGVPCSLPIIFNATLSIASEVAYDPGECVALQGKKTVQDAISGLAALVRIDMVAGDGQDTDGGQPVPDQLIVRVSNACGPVKDASVAFTVFEGFVAKDSADLVSSTEKTISLPTNGNGIAECRWRTATAPGTQQLRAEIIQLPALPAGLAMGAHGSVLFTANLRPGKDCCVTVGAGGDFPTLETAITTLIGRDVQEICICLLPGDHEVSQLVVIGGTANSQPVAGAKAPDNLPLNIETIPSALRTAVGTFPPSVALRHLHIHGCGRASRILLKSWFVAMNLSSIALQDLCIYADAPDNPAGPQFPRIIFIHNCGDVTITGCHLRQTVARNDWVIVSAAEHINIADNVIESSARTRFIPISVEDTGTAVTNAAPTNVRVVAETAAANLAGKKKSERAAFIKEFRKIVKDVPRDDPKKKSLAAALKHLSAKSSLKQKSAPVAVDATAMAAIETPQGLADSVTGGVPNLFNARAALVIADADADTTIVNNVITGDVRFYGIDQSIAADQLKLVAQGIRASGMTLGVEIGTTERDANLQGNILTRLTVDKRINAVLPWGQDATKRNIINGVFNRMSLLNNTFSAPANGWVGGHVIFNGNRFNFELVGKNEVGIVGAISLICLGNSSKRQVNSLLHGIPTGPSGPFNFQAAANLINIDTV